MLYRLRPGIWRYPECEIERLMHSISTIRARIDANLARAEAILHG